MPPIPGKEILYLSRDQVIACDLSLADIEGTVHNAFLRHSEGKAWSHRKVTIKASGNAVFRGKGGVLKSPNFGAFKWFGYFPSNADRGLRDFSPMVLLNDGSDGLPMAVMDGTWLSEVRTAAITLVAARLMARAEARRIGFVACGAQARRHLETFVRAFPLNEVVAYSRRRATAEAFAVLAREMGLRAEVTESPEAAVTGADIVISSVPHGAAGGGLLHGDWVSPGTFVAAVDLGFGWRRESLCAFDRTFTDDHEQSTTGPGGTLNYDGPFTGEIADLVSGRMPGRVAETERNALIFSGTGLADVAVAARLYEAALAKGIGTVLPL